ncbi:MULTISPECIES: DNA repair protein RecN [Brevibacillus]|jgi:DNA repair protein RecN (Recombination protein N)|uniref:DNA repair protein RecN n=1 Tax=Brevibacillus borstelensis AK1 TaxID=1300222 RepID=M8DJU9_9BACL|nr:DNA repair protein RecN [Brevibacillus borstelensis]EMT53722.1 DNA repair protein [Brevibacillus borstelensis AK1]KKX56864.1 DNA recombination protein RecN [Brevibacillus borstelensis cifa_chp40]MBE5394636.1 DNA repair protein RecN [Brevibacillus borstelensis]MCM3469785.1 DNA repair protein RecN [Brevibacillus borstelensis]MCM3589512.1 DNA repair protein RecN [Brevibacillus borstelensis]
MLLELSIRNFAIIKSVTISFQKGLNILTGETGAGKSIIIDALGLLLGGRASTDFVRYGETRAEVEGLFELPSGHPAFSVCESFGVQVEQDNTLVVRRDISSQGKSIIRINGQLVTLAMLRELGPWLVTVHGQHDTHMLMQADKHIHWLDSYGEKEMGSAKQEYAQLFGLYSKTRQDLERMSKNERELVQRIDLLQYQLNEIEAASLAPGEDEKLLQQRKKWMNIEKVFAGIQDAYRALHGDQRGSEWLGHAMSELERIVSYDDQLGPILETVQSAYYQVEDAVHQLRQLSDRLDFEPEQLQEVERRLDLIQTLKRKYGKNVDDILEYAATIQDELDEMHHYDDRLQQLEKRLVELAADLAVEALELSMIRRSCADRLAKEIEQQLRELHMERARFAIDVRQIPDENGVEIEGAKWRVDANGIDTVEFLISPNPGEPLRPLAKIASGGELSRVMLAIKTILAGTDQVQTLIFDEVDTGVSGRAAQAIAEKLARVALQRQVLCITHLPQVASLADAHFLIQKEMSENETMTLVHSLREEERVTELARMLSGAEVTAKTEEHAREMITLGRQRKAAK